MLAIFTASNPDCKIYEAKRAYAILAVGVQKDVWVHYPYQIDLGFERLQLRLLHWCVNGSSRSRCALGPFANDATSDSANEWSNVGIQ